MSPDVQEASAPEKAAGSGGESYRLQIVDGYFRDDRWVNGTWDFQQFPGDDGETNWDAVIDAEMARRKMLEDSPIPSRNDDPVNFDTNMVPWWAWVKRFHLPEAEKLNGRAAMVGYLLAGLTELASGAGLVEQQVCHPCAICTMPVHNCCLHAHRHRNLSYTWSQGHHIHGGQCVLLSCQHHHSRNASAGVILRQGALAHHSLRYPACPPNLGSFQVQELVG